LLKRITSTSLNLLLGTKLIFLSIGIYDNRFVSTNNCTLASSKLFKTDRS
jgi:hypothetical protein